MINLVSGFLSFYFDNAVLLTVLVSFLLLAWYRRAVTRSMQSVAHAPEAEGLSEDGCAVVAENSVLRYADAVSDVPTGEHTLADEQRIRMRLILVYTAGGAAAAAILTISFLFSLNDELYALRTFVIWYTYCWPIVPTLAVLLTIPQKKALLAFGGYVLVGAAIVLAWSALRRFALGHMDVFPVSYVKYYALFLAMQAWFPFLIIFITGNRRLRSASPFVLAGLLIFSFSNLVTDDGLTVALDNQVFRHYFLVFDHTLMRGLWFMLAALPVGYLCWRGLRWLSRRFERKAFSDTQLLVDSWWLIVAFQQASDNAVDFGWVGLAVGLLAFVAYRSVVGLGLAVWPATNSASGRGRLLLLRVFGSQRRSERLFDAIAQRWRLRGSVKLIAGADLAMRILDPADFIAFVGGRMRRLFVRSIGDLTRRIERLDEARDPDGRFRIAKFYCHENTWRPTLRELLRRSDVVLMDLRGFSAANSGCEFELHQLAASGLLPSSVFVIDDTTDVGLLESIVYDGASEPGAVPLNLERMTSHSAGGLTRIFRRLCSLAAGPPVAGTTEHNMSVAPSPLLPAA